MESAGAAVIVFFVLSGFVIRYVSRRTPGTFTSYAIDRASRIYSVLLPAVILTCVVSVRFGYLRISSAPQACAFALRITQILLFTNWSWHQQVTLPPNGALWSISFECLFYLLYGAWFYLRGRGRILCLLLAAAWAGPEILTFFPVWLGGCLLYELFLTLRNVATRRLARVTVVAGATFGCLILATRHLLAASLHWMAMRFHLLQGRATASQSTMHLLWPRIGHGAPISLNAYPEAALYFVAILVLLLFADHLPLSGGGLIRNLSSKLADATFPLYLFHLPLFCIAVRLLGRPVSSTAEAVLLLAAVVGISVMLAPLLSQLKNLMRRPR
jgi:peptidoglycan/LPS O-acetylase OafA/YrhL